VKHAFPSERIGNIYVSLTKKDDNYLLIVKDDGIGIKEDLDISNIGSLGLQLVHYLTNQLEGEIRLDRSFGTEFRIKFKELEYKKRI
jgi:two-component sensor histidine kinase